MLCNSRWSIWKIKSKLKAYNLSTNNKISNNSARASETSLSTTRVSLSQFKKPVRNHSFKWLKISPNSKKLNSQTSLLRLICNQRLSKDLKNRKNSIKGIWPSASFSKNEPMLSLNYSASNRMSISSCLIRSLHSSKMSQMSQWYKSDWGWERVLCQTLRTGRMTQVF